MALNEVQAQPQMPDAAQVEAQPLLAKLANDLRLFNGAKAPPPLPAARCHEGAIAPDSELIEQLRRAYMRAIEQEPERCGKYFALRITTEFASLLQTLGEYDLAIRLVENRLAAGGSTATSADYCELRKMHGVLAMECGAWHRAEESLGIAAETAKRIGDVHTGHEARILLGKLNYRTGRYHRASAILSEVMDEVERVGNLRNIAQVKIQLGMINRILGRTAKAAGVFQECLLLAQTLQDSEVTAEALNQLSIIALRRENFDEAGRCLEKAYRLCFRERLYALLPFVLLNRASLCLQAGDLDLVPNLILRSIEALSQSRNPAGVATAFALTARMFVKFHRLEQALAACESCIALYAKYDIPLGLANAYLEAARLLQQLRRFDEAAEHERRGKSALRALQLENLSAPADE